MRAEALLSLFLHTHLSQSFVCVVRLCCVEFTSLSAGAVARCLHSSCAAMGALAPPLPGIHATPLVSLLQLLRRFPWVRAVEYSPLYIHLFCAGTCFAPPPAHSCLLDLSRPTKNTCPFAGLSKYKLSTRLSRWKFSFSTLPTLP